MDSWWKQWAIWQRRWLTTGEPHAQQVANLILQYLRDNGHFTPPSECRHVGRIQAH